MKFKRLIHSKEKTPECKGKKVYYERKNLGIELLDQKTKNQDLNSMNHDLLKSCDIIVI